MNTLENVKLINLPKIADDRGNLSIIESVKNIPFTMKRVHWIYDVPGGIDRGGHAFVENEEFIVALSGSFDVLLDDGKEKKVISLKRSYYGLYIPNGIWRVMNDFSTNALALVLSSNDYSDDDYILDYEEFKKWRAAR
ncbi:MAG: WxcM-like domain-containing protein [Bacteroidales bacterium]|nr:WxcM-like domain-containing protein [Bacteroidales bacterium]